jgi:EAL domain-containing protein (putative c-di-GMP-specific phosphodiesterase class I)
LVVDVAEALEGAALDPRLLTLEITESILLEDIEVVVERLTELKRLGVRLAIDDFGTGYSSLSYLRRLPVDVLKIDRSFVAAVDSGVAEGALVRSIVSIAQILELRTVAEGIEQIGQLEALRAIGVDQGQGFLFARPLEPEALPELLSRPRGKPARSRPGRVTARSRRLAPPATASPS